MEASRLDLGQRADQVRRRLAFARGEPQELSLTFKGNTYLQTFGGNVNESGTFKIDTAKKPMTMDLTITEGSDAGKAQPGIVDGGGKEAEALSARSRSRVINGGKAVSRRDYRRAVCHVAPPLSPGPRHSACSHG